MSKNNLLWVLLLLCFYCSLHTATAQILIVGVQYDPPGSDTGKEWVQIANLGDDDVHIHNYSLQSGNGAQPEDWTEEYVFDQILPAQQSIVVGEGDNVTLATNLDLQNGPDAVRLLDQHGEIVDLVGWGEHEYDEYVETAGAQDQGDGFGIRRHCVYEDIWNCYDTDNNQDDFSSIELSAYYFSGYSSENHDIFVQAQTSILQNLTVQDSVESLEGVQWLGQSTPQEIVVNFSVTTWFNDSALVQVVKDDQVVYERMVELCSCQISTTVHIPAYLAPGPYEVRVVNGETQLGQVVEVLQYQALTTEFIHEVAINDLLQIGILKIKNELAQPLEVIAGVALNINNTPVSVSFSDTTLLYGSATTVQLNTLEEKEFVLRIPLQALADMQQFNGTLNTWVDMR